MGKAFSNNGKGCENEPWSARAAVGDRSELKARQAARIKEIGEALVAEGIDALDRQAAVLGLSRSTTWTIVRANHKNSGLSAAIIKRMLAAPNLPPRVRLKIFQYAHEKRAGHFGDSKSRLLRFQARLSAALKDMPRGVQRSGVQQSLFQQTKESFEWADRRLQDSEQGRSGRNSSSGKLSQ